MVINCGNELNVCVDELEQAKALCDDIAMLWSIPNCDYNYTKQYLFVCRKWRFVKIFMCFRVTKLTKTEAFYIPSIIGKFHGMKFAFIYK